MPYTWKMITFSKKDSIYIGREAGKEIHERIRGANKSVKVVSPYLSPDYIRDLIQLHKQGREITLITCDNIETNPYSDFKTSELVEKEKKFNKKKIRLKKRYKKISWRLFIFALILYLPGFLNLLPVFFLIFGGLIMITSIGTFIHAKNISAYSVKYRPIFRIKVFDSSSGKNPRSTELVHSKIFVIDEEVAFLGSVNYTYSGFKTHYETTIKVEDKNAVDEISKEVEKLYNSYDLKAKTIEEWAEYVKK